MSSLIGNALPVVRRVRERVPLADLGAGAAALGAAALAGIAAGAGYGIPLIATAVVLATLVLGMLSWRRSLTWMMLYLPISGILPLLMYPNTGPGVLLKDALFVVPAYVGFFVAAVRRREEISVPRAPYAVAAALFALVLIESFNPSLPKPLIALIGIKVWVFYVPLFVLGYFFPRSPADVRLLLKRMTIVAMIPCVLGIVEAALIYGGKADLVYSFYGDAAKASTQGFTTFDFGGGNGLTRIPSTFTFISQYWLFSTATVAIAWAAWRSNRRDRMMAWLGPVAITVAVFASMTSGARAAFIFTPFLLLLLAAFDGVRISRAINIAVLSLAAIFVTLTVFNIPGVGLAENTSGHGVSILDFFGEGFDFARNNALLGLGTGVDSNAARYAFGGIQDYGVVYATLGGVWYESWYLKAFIELGALGLVLLVALLVQLMRRSIAYHRQVSDPELRSVSAAGVALFIWIIVYTVKTAYIDFDPMAVYIWFFLGLAWRMRTLGPSGGSAEPSPVS